MPHPLGAIRLSELPAAEARAIFERFVAGQPDRLDRFLAEVRRRDGPADRLDFSIESLEPLWRWFVSEHRPRRWLGGPHRMPTSPVTDAAMRASNPPWWYDFHPQFGQRARSLRGDTRHRAGRVRLRVRAPRKPRFHVAELERLARPLAAYAVAQIDHPSFTHAVSFAEAATDRQERRIARLVERLAERDGIEAAIHEDREIVLVRAPRLSVSGVESVIAELWKPRRARSHGDGA